MNIVFTIKNAVFWLSLRVQFPPSAFEVLEAESAVFVVLFGFSRPSLIFHFSIADRTTGGHIPNAGRLSAGYRNYLPFGKGFAKIEE